MVRLAQISDIDAVSKLASKNNKFLGFVMKVSLQEAIQRKELIVYDNGEILGFCNFHFNKTGYITIYEICTDQNARGKGIGKALFQYCQKRAPIQLKVTIDNTDAHKFYDKMGGFIARKEQGKKRELLVYRFNKI